MSVKGEIEWAVDNIADFVGANEGQERRIRDIIDGLVYNVRNETRMEIMEIVNEGIGDTARKVEAIRWVS
jgi:hypothetical protein